MPFEPPPPGAEGVPEVDPVRDQLRELLVHCDRHIRLARGRVQAAERGDNMVALGALAAAYAGMAADAIEGEDSDIPTGMAGDRSCNARGDDPQSTGCREGQSTVGIPVTGAAPTPRTEALTAETGASLDDLADVLAAMDDMLDGADPSTWDQAALAEWQRLTELLERRCHALD